MQARTALPNTVVNAPFTEPPELQLRVKVTERKASTAQSIVAFLLWGGTLILLGACVFAVYARNVQLRPAGVCTPCGNGFYSLQPGTTCPKICVAESLKNDIDAKCAKPPSHRLKSGNLTHVFNDVPVSENFLAAGQKDVPTKPVHGSKTDDPQLSESAIYEQLEASSDVMNKSLMQLLASPTLLPIFFPMLLLISVVWFWLLQKAAHMCIWSTIVFCVIGLAYAYYLTLNWMMLIIAAVVIAVAIIKCSHINLGCKCLQFGLAALMQSPCSLIVLVATAVLLLIYTALLVAALVLSSQVFHVTVDDSGNCNLQVLGSKAYAVLLVFFQFSSSFFYMVTNFSVAIGIGCWYFHSGDSAAPRKPMAFGLKLALLSRNGAGVCGQAAALMTCVEYIEKKVKKPKCLCLDPIWCFLICVYTCFSQCLESLCSFAVVAVALAGGSFCETSRNAMQTLGTARTGRFLVIDSSLGWLLRLQATAISTLFGIAVWAAIDASENLGMLDAIARGAKTAGGIDAKYAQWWIVGVVLLFFWFMRRPLFSMSAVILWYVFLRDLVADTYVNSALASLFVGSIGSLLFHQFAEAAMGALGSMLYCWSLEEAIIGVQGVRDQSCRQHVAALWQESMALLLPSESTSVIPTPPQPIQVVIPTAPQPFQVVCPVGVSPGQSFYTSTQDGRILEVLVPAGVQPGEGFQIIA